MDLLLSSLLISEIPFLVQTVIAIAQTALLVSILVTLKKHKGE